MPSVSWRAPISSTPTAKGRPCSERGSEYLPGKAPVVGYTRTNGASTDFPSMATAGAAGPVEHLDSWRRPLAACPCRRLGGARRRPPGPVRGLAHLSARDRKSTRLNSSHGYISYAVFCLKKKKQAHSSLLDAQCV